MMHELKHSLGAKPQIYIIFYSLPFQELKEASKQSICKQEYRALPSEHHQCCYCYELSARYRGLFLINYVLLQNMFAFFFFLEVEVCRASTTLWRGGEVFIPSEIFKLLANVGCFKLKPEKGYIWYITIFLYVFSTRQYHVQWLWKLKFSICPLNNSAPSPPRVFYF